MSLNVSGYNISDIYVGDDKIDKIFVGEDLVYTSGGVASSEPFCVTMNNAAQTMGVLFKIQEYNAASAIQLVTPDLSNYPSFSPPALVYSYDAQNWNTYTLNTAIYIGGSNSNKVYFKSTSATDDVGWIQERTADNNTYRTCLCCNTCDNRNNPPTVSVSGNINSLITSEYVKLKTLRQPYVFSYLFYSDNCKNITDASALELPSLSLSTYCYYRMFCFCARLTAAPELPATTLADCCYRNMFTSCKALTTAPELPATTLATYCYSYMFYECTALTTLSELPATTLAPGCYYYMFAGCTALTTPPELPVTTLASNCYSYMFYECTALTTPPELPATTLVSSCYYGMFQKCASLTTPPELPATTLASSCYSYMFSECTSLMRIPRLPVLDIPSSAYSYMFSFGGIYASSSSSSPCIYSYRIPSAGEGTAANKALDSMFYKPDGSGNYTPSINTTFYINVPSF